MIEIKLYGTTSSWYQYIKKYIEDILLFNEIEYTFVEIRDVKQFIHDNVKSVPSITINGGEVIELLSPTNINSSLNKLVDQIIKHLGKNLKKSILVPIDYSENSKAALAFATSLFNSQPYILHALHVYHPFSPAYINLNEDSIKDLEKNKLHDFISLLENDLISRVRLNPPIIGDIFPGLASDIILERANQSDLIVMGSNGKSSLERLFFGSVSKSVIENCRIPVIIVPQIFHFSVLKNLLVVGQDHIEKDFLALITKENLNIHFTTDLDLENLKYGDQVSQMIHSDETIVVLNKKHLTSSFALLGDKGQHFYEEMLKKGKPIIIHP